MALAEAAFAATTAEAASAAFFAAAQRLGATYQQTRVYRRPQTPLTSQTHWAAGGVIARFAPQDWPGSRAFDYVCFECNPLLEPIRNARTRYRFSDFAPREERSFGAYWEALGEAKIGEALCATSYGPSRSIATVHLGFEDRNLPQEDVEAVQLGGLMLTERLMMLAEPPEAEVVGLTPRERDALGWVAQGKSDWEISVILGVSEATARWHVDNGRRKLGAVNRAQAVARMAAAGLL